MLSSFITLLITSSVLSVPVTPGASLNLADQYPRSQVIPISVTNHENYAITLDEAGQCHRFFRVFSGGIELSITPVDQICTQEFRTITLAPHETKVIDQWDQMIHTYCPPFAQCFAPDILAAGEGHYTIRVQVGGPQTFELSKEIRIGNGSFFTDVPTSHWAYTYINDLFSKNIINGYGDGRFGPENSITRGELVKIAINAALQKGLYADQVPSCFPSHCNTRELPPANFLDVSSSDTFYPYITLASRLSIIDSTPYFHPNDKATRFDCLKTLLNAFQKQQEVISAAPASTPSFNDVAAPAMTPYTNYGQSEGIISGINHNFYPNEFVRRGEIAKIAYNLLSN